MTRQSIKTFIARVTLAMVGTLLLAGCSFDYLNHADRVSYRAGDAVAANLEQATTNPSHDSQYSTSALGKDGAVVPDETAAPQSSPVTVNVGAGG